MLSDLSIAFLPDFVVESSVFNVVIGEFVVETFTAIYEIEWISGHWKMGKYIDILQNLLCIMFLYYEITFMFAR